MFSEGNIWVYYVSLLVCGAGALILNASGTQYSLLEAAEGVKRKKIVWIVTFFMVGYIVFWAAIRNGIVDTAEYITAYEMRSTNMTLKQIFSKSEDRDAPLFIAYQVLLKKLGFNWQQYLASIAIISGFFVAYGISKYSDDVPFTYYLFITGTHYFWLFNGIRQFVVASVIFACLKWFAEKKWWKLLIVVSILYFVHTSVIIVIPIYFIANMKNWSYGIYACILATIAVVLLFPSQFVSFLDTTFTDYDVAENFAKDDGVNILRFLVSMVTPTLAFIYKNELALVDNRYIKILINMSLISAGLYAVGVVTSGIYIGRLPLYTDLYGILFLPYLIKNILPKNTKGPIWVAALMLYFLYFYLQTKISNGVYYTTNLIEGLNMGGAQL
ncbi:MAG: EpsG family protein [Clostridia bacterium]|nr:EpsG family protein [Clostridia bacterium]